MTPELPSLRLDDYRAPEIYFDCDRCRRHAVADCGVLRRKFGNIRLGEIARRVAAAGIPPCALATLGDGTSCSARPVEVPFERWAQLRQAKDAGWGARLRCARHLEALKRARPCPEVVDLDLDTLIAGFGYDLPMERLRSKLACPHCCTRSILIEWIEPAERPRPGGQVQTGNVLRLAKRA